MQDHRPCKGGYSLHTPSPGKDGKERFVQMQITRSGPRGHLSEIPAGVSRPDLGQDEAERGRPVAHDLSGKEKAALLDVVI